MPEIVCKNCGQNEGFYRNVEIEGTAWVDAEISGHEDGSFSGTTDDYVQDKQTEISFHMEWGCAACMTEKNKLEDLVEFKQEEEVDPIARAQKFPIQGQEAMSV